MQPLAARTQNAETVPQRPEPVTKERNPVENIPKPSQVESNKTVTATQNWLGENNSVASTDKALYGIRLAAKEWEEKIGLMGTRMGDTHTHTGTKPSPK